MRPAQPRPTFSSLLMHTMSMRTSRKLVLALVIVAVTLLVYAVASDDDISSPLEEISQLNDYGNVERPELVFNNGAASPNNNDKEGELSSDTVTTPLTTDTTTTSATASTTATTAILDPPPRPVVANNDLFLAYLPHGDYFSQRQSLENAIVLAWLTGRTLVVPPAIVDRVVPLEPYETLSQRLSDLTSEEAPGRRELCAKDASFVWCKVDEFNKKGDDGKEMLHNATLIKWSELLDFEFAAQNVHVLHRPTVSSEDLYDLIEVEDSNQDVFNVDRYRVQIYESTSTEWQESEERYTEMMTVSDLQLQDDKLILLGSLNGTERLVLSSPDALKFRDQVAKSFANLNQPAMRRVADEIVQQLGGQGNYVGVYMRGIDVTATRKNDKNAGQYEPGVLKFKEKVDVTLVSRIVEMLNMHQQENIQLLEDPESPSSSTPLTMTACTAPTSHINVFVVPWLLPPDDRRWNPRGAMTALFRSYPCIFTLPDFYYLFVPVDEISDNGNLQRDGTGIDSILPEFLKRMIEANVLARSRQVMFGVNAKVVNVKSGNIELEKVTPDVIHAVSSVRNTLGLPVDAFHLKNLTPELPKINKRPASSGTKSTKRKKGSKKRP